MMALLSSSRLPCSSIAEYNCMMTDVTGRTVALRGLTYYRLADGKIVEDDPFSTPDLAQELGALLAATSD